MHRNLKKTILASGIAALLLLTGCAAETDSSSSDKTEAPETTSATSTSEAPSPTAEEIAADSMETAAAAVQLAESSVPGSKAVELDWDDGKWKVTVVAGNQETEFEIDADGKNVINREDDDDDSDDAEYVKQVKISIIDASEIALDEVPGEFDSADLDEEDGNVVWKIEIDDPNDVEVYVSAVDGKIIKVDR